MIGLEKVTGKLLAEAEEDAAAVISAAEEKCRKINEFNDAEIKKTADEARSAVDIERANIFSRARSAAGTETRNIILAAKCEILDAAFDEAKERICKLPGQDYESFIVSRIKDAICANGDNIPNGDNVPNGNKVQRGEKVQNRNKIPNRNKAQNKNKVHKGHNTPNGRCILSFNERDKIEIGDRIVSRLNREYPDMKFTVSSECAPISGGVCLDLGDTDVDCSVDVLISQIRWRLEGRVCKILFDDKM